MIIFLKFKADFVSEASNAGKREAHALFFPSKASSEHSYGSFRNDTNFVQV